MAWIYELIQPEDIKILLEFEESRLKELFPDPQDRMFHQWHSSARQESLEHYVRVGWSFKALNEDGKLMGFVLAQPLLFFSGHTQVLWVEYLSTLSLQARDSLIDLVYRLSREKHLQGIFFPAETKLLNALGPYRPKDWAGRIFVATVK